MNKFWKRASNAVVGSVLAVISTTVFKFVCWFGDERPPLWAILMFYFICFEIITRRPVMKE